MNLEDLFIFITTPPPKKKKTHTHTPKKKKRKPTKNNTKEQQPPPPAQNKQPDPKQNPPCPYMLAIYNDCTPTYCSLLVFHACSDEYPHIKEESVKKYTFYHSIICFHLFYRKPCFR